MILSINLSLKLKHLVIIGQRLVSTDEKLNHLLQQTLYMKSSTNQSTKMTETISIHNTIHQYHRNVLICTHHLVPLYLYI